MIVGIKVNAHVGVISGEETKKVGTKPQDVSSDELVPEETVMQSPEHVRSHVLTKNTLLATCLVSVLDSQGNCVTARALLDSGSQANLITEKCAQLLGLKRQKCHVTVQGLGTGDPQIAKGSLSLYMQNPLLPHSPNPFDALILPSLSGPLPAQPVALEPLAMLHTLSLADPSFHIPAPVDLILGIDTFNELAMEGIMREGKITYCRTIFGWSVSGVQETQSSLHIRLFHVRILSFVGEVSGLYPLDYDPTVFWVAEGTVASKGPPGLSGNMSPEL